jgi:hypothetical protein
MGVFGLFPIQAWLANWSQVGLGLVVPSQHGLVWLGAYCWPGLATDLVWLGA